jgi:hypothetical protein
LTEREPDVVIVCSTIDGCILGNNDGDSVGDSVGDGVGDLVG